MRRGSSEFDNDSIFTELQKALPCDSSTCSACACASSSSQYVADNPSWTILFHMYVKVLPPNSSRWSTKAGPAPRPLRAALEVATGATSDHLKMTAPSIPFILGHFSTLDFQGLLLESSEMQVHAGFKPRERALQVLILTKRNPHQDK